jgi:hypothetical protein
MGVEVVNEVAPSIGYKRISRSCGRHALVLKARFQKGRRAVSVLKRTASTRRHNCITTNFCANSGAKSGGSQKQAKIYLGRRNFIGTITGLQGFCRGTRGAGKRYLNSNPREV